MFSEVEIWNINFQKCLVQEYFEDFFKNSTPTFKTWY